MPYPGRESFEDIGEGDEVFLQSGGWHPQTTKEVVTRTTKTQIIIRNQRFRRDRGEVVGRSPGSFSASSWIKLVTDESEAEYQAELLERREKADRSNFVILAEKHRSRLPIAQIRACLVHLLAHEKKEKEEGGSE